MILKSGAMSPTPTAQVFAGRKRRYKERIPHAIAAVCMIFPNKKDLFSIVGPWFITESFPYWRFVNGNTRPRDRRTHGLVEISGAGLKRSAQRFPVPFSRLPYRQLSPPDSAS
jgi:hypothetical protein